ncbi:hypothetical protein Thiowin_04218 [Thiorhodovibrio winogradskyi]|uniref:PEP-CTERM protein-sorting domain-containing protein n=1 Tax=Thiorhodovibrio winogradskyi TaxID=77007 RepID=A0ABZ0SEM6_9GAMM|nr:hypothetical protein [Thiorhodovibrio winogradskyi]
MTAFKDIAIKKADKNGSTPWYSPISTASAATLALLLNATVTLASPIYDPDTSDTVNYVEDESLGTVDIDIVDGIFSNGSDTLKIIFNDGDTDKEAWVKAGAFGGAVTPGDTDPFDPKDLYRSDDDVIFYCVDLFANLKTHKSTYTVLPIEDGAPLDTNVNGKAVSRDFGNLLSFLGALNWVLSRDQYGFKFEDQNWLNPSSGNMSAAIQVGIWESLYDSSSGMDIAGGNFKVTHLANVDGLNDNQTLLDSVFNRMDDSNNVALANDKVLLFHSSDGQDLIADPVDVPAPATLPLLLGGLLLLGNFGRRLNGPQR